MLAGMAKNQERLAVIIVTWNVRDLVLDCLESLYTELEQLPLTSSVFVVDNGSSDDTAAAIRARYPHTLVIEEPGNPGFAGGNNRALRQVGFSEKRQPVDENLLPEFVLLLNPDTIVKQGAIKRLLRGLESSGAGLAGACLTFGDGSFQHSAFMFPGLKQLAIDLYGDVVPARLHERAVNGRYPRALYESKEPFEIDFPLGAVWLLKRKVVLKTGKFDPRFYMYCEEIDWAIRIHEAGYKVVCVPTAHIVHLGGQSTGQVRPQSVVNLWLARLKLYTKHYDWMVNKLARILIRAGMRRNIRRTKRDTSLDPGLREDLLNAYYKVLRLSSEEDILNHPF